MADGPHVLPAAPVEAAGEPDDGPLGLEDLGPGQQVLRDARQHGGDADADEHEPVRRHARSSTPAGRWRRRRRGRRRAAPNAVARGRRVSTTMQNTAAALAPASMPMMSGLASGLRARLWKIAPDSPNATPTSTPVSARGRRSVRTMNSASSVPVPEDRRDDVAERDREVADADRHAERRRTSATAQRRSSTVAVRASGAASARGRSPARRRRRRRVTARPSSGGARGR